MVIQKCGSFEARLCSAINLFSQETVDISETGSARGITISLPRVEMLESSDAQTPSPGDNNAKTRR